MFDSDSGLPQNTILAIAETSDGYLWVATELGLARFDGARWTTLNRSNTPKLGSNKISALLEDHSGALWVGTQGGGLTRIHSDFATSYSVKDGLPGNSIHCLMQDHEDSVWVGFNGGGAAHFHHGRFEQDARLQPIAKETVVAIVEDRNHTLWFATLNGLAHLADDHLQIYRPRDGLPSLYVRSLLTDSDGAIWVGTDRGLARWRDGRFEPLPDDRAFTGRPIYSLTRGSDGALWVGTLYAGLVRVTAGGIEYFNRDNGFPANDIYSLHQDRNGSLWVGTGGAGLMRLYDQTPIVSYDMRDGLSNDTLLAVMGDRDGSTVWMGTNGGGLNRLRNGKFSALMMQDGLPSNVIFSLTQDREGAIWAGARGGLCRIVHGRMTVFHKRDGLPTDTANVLYTDSAGVVWVGTRNGLARFGNRSFTTPAFAEALPNHVILSLLEDRKHRLWIGTAGGLGMVENRQLRVFRTPDGLSSDVVMSMHEDREGTLWFGTDGGGLSRWKDGHFTTFTARDGLHDDAVFRILEDRTRHLWLSSDLGISRVAIQDLQRFADHALGRIPTVAYGKADGMNTEECNGGIQPAGWAMPDGRLFFPTMHGVSVADTTQFRESSSQQRSFIEHMVADDQPVRLAGNVQISPGVRRFEIYYAAPNLRAGNRVRFRYRLEGFDKNWVEVGNRRVAYYTNIPPGQYRFLVEATNENGTWSPEAATLPVELLPHFYQTTDFYWLAGIVAFVLACLAHATYTKQMRERERELETRVTQRTAELQGEVAERKLAQAESMRAREAAERANRVKSEFLATMSHEIRTPMNAILGMTRLALGTELSVKQKSYLNIISDSADSLLALIDDILDFSKVEAGKLDLHITDFHLRELLHSVVSSLAFRADQKRIALSYTIDPKVPAVIHSDSARLRQVLVNLLGNSLKFTEHGEVRLEVQLESRSGKDAVLRFTVRDTGIGIAPDKLSSIFDAFSQADSSTTRRFGGTGLGLAICNRLVSLLGGKIWATSRPGHGSQFQFTMAAGVAHGAELHAEPEIEVPSVLALLRATEQPAIRVLLAEDNPNNRILARETLENAGVHVTEAENGREAVTRVTNGTFDVVLMDCRMPVLDGYEAARMIRELPPPAGRLPILALTASAFKEDREMATDAGMDDFIAKPFNDRELLYKVLFWARHGLLDSESEERPPVSGSLRALADGTPHRTPAEQADPLNNGKYSPELLESLMSTFIDTAPPVFEKLSRALDLADYKDAREAAHWLRGGAVRMLDPELQMKLDAVEHACVNANSVPQEDVEILHMLFHRACKKAENWLAEHAQASTLTGRA